MLANKPKTPGLQTRAMPDSWTRRLILVDAGLVWSGIALVAWLVAGLSDDALLGAVAGSVIGGGVAGVVAARYRDTLLIALVAVIPPLAVDLLAVPPSPYSLGGIIQVFAVVVILGFAVLGFIGALIGVRVQPRVDRRATEGPTSVAVFTIAAGIAVVGWTWFAASRRSS